MRDLGGSLQVSPGVSLPTYCLAANDISPVTASFDVLNIANPATSTVVFVMTKVVVSMDATAASTMDCYLVRRTAANTGGTAVPITYGAATSALSGSVSFTTRDTNDPTSQAVVNAYSSNPTYGAGTTIDVSRLTVPAISLPGVPVVSAVMQWSDRGAKPPVIRPGQFFAVSFGGQTSPAGAGMYVSIEWVEVPLSNWM